MITSYFLRPLEINIKGNLYKFCSVLDFEFSLNGRNAVPASKIIELLNYPSERLRNEAQAISKMEKHLIEILSRSIDSPKTIKRAIKELNYNAFSNDHGWRDIFISLQDVNGDIGDTLLRVALYKYTQYLNSRLEIIKMSYPQAKDTVASQACFG